MKRFLFGVAVGFALYHAWLVFREMFGTPAMPDDFHEWTEAELDSLKAYLKGDWHNIDLELPDELKDTQPVKIDMEDNVIYSGFCVNTEADTQPIVKRDKDGNIKSIYSRKLDIEFEPLSGTQPVRVITQDKTSVNNNITYSPQQEHIYTDNGPIQVTYD